MSDEEYEFQYSDDEGGDAGAAEDDTVVKIQNLFYASKAIRDTDAAGAIAGFNEVMELAGASTEFAEWSFKSLKNIVKLDFRSGRLMDMLASYKKLLARINAGDVTRNRSEKAINSILDLVSGVEHSAASMSVDHASGDSSSSGGQLQEFYTVTLDALASSTGNDRLAFKTQLKLARLHQSRRNWPALRELLRVIEASLASPGSAAAAADADRSKATQLLEVCALQIQMHSELRDTKRCAEAFQRAKGIAKSAVPHPSITGTIQEVGGKLAMGERDWEAARLYFLEAFKAYEEAGLTERTLACLRYLLLANMLSSSRINPFDSQETKAYERDPSITPMTALTDAYLADDIAAFEPVLKGTGAAAVGGGGMAAAGARPMGAGAGSSGGGLSLGAVMDDFMRSYVGDLLASIRTKVLLALVGPYTRVALPFLAAELNMPAGDLEALCVGLILDGRLCASIDQVGAMLLLRPAPAAGAQAASGGGPGNAVAGGGSSSSRLYAEMDTLAGKLAGLVRQLPAASLSASQYAADAGAAAAHASGGGGGGGMHGFAFG